MLGYQLSASVTGYQSDQQYPVNLKCNNNSTHDSTLQSSSGSGDGLPSDLHLFQSANDNSSNQLQTSSSQEVNSEVDKGEEEEARLRAQLLKSMAIRLKEKQKQLEVGSCVHILELQRNFIIVFVNYATINHF